MRINKYLASCGLCSRRKADTLIEKGRVTINGMKATMGCAVEIGDDVKVSNKSVTLEEKKVYYMLHKPKGYLTAVSDPRERTIMELVRIKERVFPVGRLDFDTEGLVVLTNDGDLFNALVHPKSAIYKRYYVRVEGAIGKEQIAAIERGVYVPHYDYTTMPAKVDSVHVSNYSTFYLSIKEGKKRQIRRMMQALGQPVEYLRRVSVGSLELGNLPQGKYRALTDKEKDMMLNL